MLLIIISFFPLRGTSGFSCKNIQTVKICRLSSNKTGPERPTTSFHLHSSILDSNKHMHSYKVSCVIWWCVNSTFSHRKTRSLQKSSYIRLCTANHRNGYPVFFASWYTKLFCFVIQTSFAFSHHHIMPEKMKRAARLNISLFHFPLETFIFIREKGKHKQK